MKELIYVADDEKNIRDLIQSFLEEEGYEVKVFENGKLLLDEFNIKRPDLVILDIMMPLVDGLTACSKIRKDFDTPIILLTARDTDADYITGFTLGCDDYFTKPFSMIKLIMRIKAIFNRLGASNNGEKNGDTLIFGDISINSVKRECFCKDIDLKLTNTEFNLLLYMIENNDKAISREDLLDKVWGYEACIETRVTDNTIKRIRKKLTEANSNISIDNVWGYGFKININE